MNSRGGQFLNIAPLSKNLQNLTSPGLIIYYEMIKGETVNRQSTDLSNANLSDEPQKVFFCAHRGQKTTNKGGNAAIAWQPAVLFS